jgi:hypothetical protein
MTGTEIQKSGVNRMVDTWTEAAKVRRSFKAGPRLRKQRVLSTTAAIFQACILLDELRNAMGAVGLPKDDVGAAIAVVTPETPDKEDQVFVLPVPQPQKLPNLFAEMAKIERPENVLSLGILVWQRDRDPKAKDKAVVWAQPFLLGPRAEAALRKAREIFADCKGGKSTFN